MSRYMAVFPDGQLQQINQEPDQEDMLALNDGDIVAIIRYHDDAGFQQAVLAQVGENQLEITKWETVQLITSPT